MTQESLDMPHNQLTSATLPQEDTLNQWIPDLDTPLEILQTMAMNISNTWTSESVKLKIQECFGNSCFEISVLLIAFGQYLCFFS